MPYRGRGKPTKVTPGLKDKFLHVLAANGGNIRAACRDVGISDDTIYEHRELDEEFKKRWAKAIDRGMDRLEDEAKRRALEGAEEPIFYRGRKVGYVYKKSDFLLAFLLRAHRPIYREKHEISGPDGQPLGAGNVIVYLPDNGRGDALVDEKATDPTLGVPLPVIPIPIEPEPKG